ncbi:MAG: M1 family metallopeptidase [Bacteroidota bacterium]
MCNFKKVLGIIVLISTISITAVSQRSNLYMTKNIKDAYDNKTRNYDGAPGEAYFQNTTDYSITVNLDPVTREISGEETITYKNNSPDTLKRIIICLYPNLFKKGAVRKKAIVPDDVNDGVTMSHIQQKDNVIDLSSKDVRKYGTNLIITLPTPIAPNSTTSFGINWHYTFQGKTNLREGLYHDSSFFVAYWYPKIAVFDDIDGWNVHSFNGEQEFYNEYGSFEVSVTVPNNYLVWASGILQNPKEVYSKRILNKYIESNTSDSIINVVTEEDINKGKLTSDNKFNTWHFHANNINDFAFATSNSYLWDASNVKIEDSTILLNAVYFKGSEEFTEVVYFTKETLLQLNNITGVAYPYPQMTAFNGEGGMEFPMMVNDGDMGSRNGAIFVTAHEVAHTYFPFYVGTNEQKYAWMDEGLVTFLPKAIEDSLSSDDSYSSFAQNIRTYSHYAGTAYDQPLMVPSDQLMGPPYMFVSYGRSAIAFYVLKNILGEQMFKQCITEFINRWEGKHPTGYDFFYTFEDVSGQNLDWFWKPWYYEFGYPDLAVENVTQDANGAKIKIKNITQFPVPVNLVVTYADSTTLQINNSANVWKDGNELFHVDIVTEKKILGVKINTNEVPDGNNANNEFIIN